jgi:hypothetical protein
MLESFVERENEDKVPVRLRGGPGDGQLFHLVGPPPVITFGAAEACYMRVPTDGFALEYRFAPGR